MQICLIVGAGASLAQAQYRRPGRTKNHPPLDTTFFPKVRSLRLHVPRTLRTYAASYPGVDPFDPAADDGTLRMEEFLKDLFFDFQESSGRGPARKAFPQFVELYASVLRQTTGWMASRHTGGPLGQLLSDAASSADRVSIITFNHDLVIENELFKRKRLRSRWCLDRGYGRIGNSMTFTSPSGGNIALFPSHSGGCDHVRGIDLLKLHGSLNWYVRYGRGRYPTPKQILGAPNQKLYATRRRTILSQFSQGTNRTWPTVVPPIYGKDLMIRALLQDVWDEARQVLTTAERVLIFGYSLPLLDVQAEKSLQRGLATNANAPFVDVINPAPESASRYAALTEKPIRWFPTSEAFRRINTPPSRG